jgi:hypothetical protein
MYRAYAVPVWAKISDMPEVTGMRSVTEEERADGILRLEAESLVLEVEIVQSTTTVGGMGTTTEKENLGTHEFDIPFDELVSVSLHGGWWRPTLRIAANRLRALEGIPGMRQGGVDLRISRRNRSAARTLVSELEFARAELELQRARRLESDAPEMLTE